MNKEAIHGGEWGGFLGGREGRNVEIKVKGGNELNIYLI